MFLNASLLYAFKKMTFSSIESSKERHAGKVDNTVVSQQESSWFKPRLGSLFACSLFCLRGFPLVIQRHVC